MQAGTVSVGEESSNVVTYGIPEAAELENNDTEYDPNY